jgi:acyl carrier protein
MQKPDPQFSPKRIDLAGLVTLIERLVADGDLPGTVAAVPLTAATRVDDLGLDSLGKLTLLEELELASGIELPETFVNEGASLGEIADQLRTLPRRGE